MTSQRNVFNASTGTTNEEINEILVQYDGFIQHLARKNVPRNVISAEEIDMEIDDLVQTTRFKLWLALQKREIHNVKNYIRGIMRNEVVTTVRQHEPTTRLVMNDEGELPQTSTVLVASKESYDPVAYAEQEEVLTCYSSKLTQHIVPLPPQQRRAILCALKEQIADLLPLADMFQPYGIDVEHLDWPEAENELRSSRVSLSIARKKLRAKKEDNTW